MISYAEALIKIRTLAQKKQAHFLSQSELLSVEPRNVHLLMGRIAAEEMKSKEAIPPFANSSMEGFAVRSEWTVNASAAHPTSLSVMATVFAGEVSTHALHASEPSCIEIMTGAPLPIGADAVVKVEDVEIKSGQIYLRAPIRAGENVRKSGTDFHPGQRILRAGARVSSEHILGLATVGAAEVKVLKKPRVALIATGNELVEKISDALSGGMIRNSTAPYLMSALPLYGAEGIFYGLVKDDPESFKTLLEKVLSDGVDVILTTGAVSKGKLDFVPGAYRDLGAKIEFHGVAIKPGRPLLFGEFENGPVIFAAPGNPVSTAVALRFFISPYLQALQGLAEEQIEPARLRGTTEKAPGLTCFWKAVVQTHLDGTEVTSLTGQESYRVSSLMPANAWILFPEAGDEFANGSVVQTLPLYPKPIFETEAHEGDCC